jgi:hypothetical protein
MKFMPILQPSALHTVHKGLQVSFRLLPIVPTTQGWSVDRDSVIYYVDMYAEHDSVRYVVDLLGKPYNEELVELIHTNLERYIELYMPEYTMHLLYCSCVRGLSSLNV